MTELYCILQYETIFVTVCCLILHNLTQIVFLPNTVNTQSSDLSLCVYCLFILLFWFSSSFCCIVLLVTLCTLSSVYSIPRGSSYVVKTFFLRYFSIRYDVDPFILCIRFFFSCCIRYDEENVCGVRFYFSCFNGSEKLWSVGTGDLYTKVRSSKYLSVGTTKSGRCII